jgi:hypothetical protein
VPPLYSKTKNKTKQIARSQGQRQPGRKTASPRERPSDNQESVMSDDNNDGDETEEDATLEAGRQKKFQKTTKSHASLNRYPSSIPGFSAGLGSLVQVHSDAHNNGQGAKGLAKSAKIGAKATKKAEQASGTAEKRKQRAEKAAENAAKTAEKTAKQNQKKLLAKVKSKLDQKFNVLVGGYQLAEIKTSDTCEYPRAISKCRPDDAATFRQMVPVWRLTPSKFKDDYEWESAVDEKGALVPGCFVDNTTGAGG